VRGSNASDLSDVPAPDFTSAADAGDIEDGATADPAGTAPKQRNTDFAQSLERGLAVIRAFGPDHPRLTLSDVARRTGLTRATARRFLLTLVELGYVDFDGRVFWLRPQVLELGYSYLSALTTPEVALPYMEDLAAKVSVSVSLGVLDREDVFYVAHVPPRRMLAVRVPVGTRVPAHATAMGQVLLAALPAAERRGYLEAAQLRKLTPQTITTRHGLTTALDTVYRNGYALGDQGLEENLYAVAVPVTDGRGSVIAALGVATQAGAPTAERLRADYLAALLESAAQISNQLRRLYMPTSR
jgi:IclR family transcriptional regulator, pca regulon regulatory protein